MADLPWDLRGHYRSSDSDMTLRDGLAEYYRVNPNLSDPEEIENPTSALCFRNHDSTHVVFGSHTGLLHEGVNDLWTILGVDIGLGDYAGGFLKKWPWNPPAGFLDRPLNELRAEFGIEVLRPEIELGLDPQQ